MKNSPQPTKLIEEEIISNIISSCCIYSMFSSLNHVQPIQNVCDEREKIHHDFVCIKIFYFIYSKQSVRYFELKTWIFIFMQDTLYVANGHVQSVVDIKNILRTNLSIMISLFNDHFFCSSDVLIQKPLNVPKQINFQLLGSLKSYFKLLLKIDFLSFRGFQLKTSEILNIVQVWQNSGCL